MVIIYRLALSLSLLLSLIACADIIGSNNTKAITIHGEVDTSVCLPQGINVAALHQAMKQAGLPSVQDEHAWLLQQLVNCNADLNELFDFLGQDVVAVNPDGEVLAQSPIDGSGLFGFTVNADTQADTLFGVLLAETDQAGNVLCLQPLEYQRLDDQSQRTLETQPALFGFEASAEPSASFDLGRFRLNELSARTAADLSEAPASRLQPGSPNFNAFIAGRYQDCANSRAVATPVNALFGFDLPDDPAVQGVDAADFAFVLALRRLEDGRFEFVNAGSIDNRGQLDLTLITDPGEDLSSIHLVVADAGFFDERKLDLPPMPIFDTTLFGVRLPRSAPVSLLQPQVIDLGTIDASLAFIDARVITNTGTTIPDTNVLGVIREEDQLALNLVRTDSEGRWQMLVPPGADYSFVAFDDDINIIGDRTVTINDAILFGSDTADIVITLDLAAFDAEPTTGPAPLEVVFSYDLGDLVNASCQLDYGDGAADTIAVCTQGELRHSYQTDGTFTASLAYQGESFSGSISLTITVGNICEGEFIIDDIDTAGDIALLSDCTAIAGWLDIFDTSLTNLESLSQLVSVEELSISFNPDLRSLAGLHNLEFVGYLYISENDALTNIDGLSQLSEAYIIEVFDSPTLESLRGFERLRRVEDLVVDNNPRLRAITGLNSLTSADALSITRNDALTSLAGLSSLDEVLFESEISDNQGFDCSPYNSQPFALPFFPVDESQGNLVDCVTK